MTVYSPDNSPEQNLDILANNSYPGRLIVIGFAGGLTIQAYGITGRSIGSRNRVLALQDNVVSTEIADHSQPVGDPELTIYDAMRRFGDTHVVSNGNQTDRVGQYIRSGGTFAGAMKATNRETDKPNYTPRITGFYQVDADEGEPYFGLSVIRGNANGHGSIRRLYTDQSPELHLDPEVDENIGFGVQTYEEDRPTGVPLPSFSEAPFRIPVVDSAKGMVDMLWDNLGENRVAAVAKTIGIVDGEITIDFQIRNEHPNA